MTKTQVESISVRNFSLWEKASRKRVPLGFDLELTARCNLNCRHCYVNLPISDPVATSEELATGEILDLARQAVNLGAVWCILTGGEPLLRPDFKEIFLGLKRLGLLVSVYTNATLVRNEQVELFRKYPPQDIEVTVYGASEKTYEHVSRIPGSFKLFKQGLQLLFDSGIKVRLKTMALRSNMNELDEIAAFCHQYTKDYYRFDPLLHLRTDENQTRNDEIRAERLSPIQIAQLERLDPERFPALMKGCDRLIEPLRSQHTYEECNSCAKHDKCEHFDRMTRLIICGAGNSGFYIAHAGSFRICPSLCAPGTTFDLRKNTLKKAWEEFAPTIRMRRADKGDSLQKCHFCAIINLCMNCPAHAYLELGNLEGLVGYFCKVAHERRKNLDEAIIAPIRHSKQKPLNR
jgi:radical SAM protein with 4Fe4S-binding SPASM domain